MRVTKQEGRTSSPPGAPRSRQALLQAGLLIIALGLGFVIHLQGWHQPFIEFAADPAFAVRALLHRTDLPSFQIDLPFENVQVLAEQRANALQLGAHVAPEDRGVPASIVHAGGEAVVVLRLPQGHAQTLAGEAWPFGVVVEEGDRPFDLDRFTLTPASEATLSAWGYLETLRRAGLPAPRYEFVRLSVNGSPWGVYALEEKAGAPDRPVVAFDSTAYWEAVIRQGDLLPGSGFQYAAVAVDCGLDPAATDPAALAPCGEALALARAVSVGEVAPSAAFDVEQMSTFLALTALWQGGPTPDWRTLRLAYDPQRATFEPLGTALQPGPPAPLPASLLDDPALQAVYARALAEFGSPDWLSEIRNELTDEMAWLRQALGSDLGRLELPWAMLEAHQAAMRSQVAPAQPLLARLEAKPTALVLILHNTQPFPVEVVGLDVSESAYLPLDPAWVDEGDREELVDGAAGIVLRAAASIHVRVDMAALPAMPASPELAIICRLWGFPNQHISVPVQYDDPAWFPPQAVTPLTIDAIGRGAACCAPTITVQRFDRGGPYGRPGKAQGLPLPMMSKTAAAGWNDHKGRSGQVGCG